MAISDRYGIQGQDTSLFELGGSLAPQAQAQTQTQAPSGVGNLERELAQIQALRASAPSGGIGETIGGAAGGVAGTYFGPVGTVVGAAAGKAIGSTVDYMINSKAQKRAEAKELKARRAQINKEKMIANANAIKADRQRLRGIAESVEQDRMTDKQRTAQERQAMLDNMMMGLQKKAQYSDFIKNKLLAGRSI
jgi:hypothetical protein